ncbi:MAG: hypothetical protein ABI151_07825 [Chitinophagaceae bacterium]
MASEQQATRIKEKYSFELLKTPGINGVGVEKENDDFVLTIHVNASNADVEKQLPRQLEGCPVRVVYNGSFKKFEQMS